MKDNYSSDKNKNRSEKESTNRHVYIEPGVQIDFVQDFRKEYKTAQQENAAQNKKQLFWTKVSAVLIVAYAIITYGILRTSQKTFEFTDRAYVGVNKMDNSFFVLQPDGHTLKIASTLDETTEMHTTAEIHNFGTVPGTNFTATWKTFIGGVEQPTSGVPYKPGTIFPSQTVTLQSSTSGQNLIDVIHANEKMDVYITVSYDIAIGHVSECTKHEFSPILGQHFLGLGTCPDK